MLELTLNDYANSLLNLIDPKVMDDREVDIRQVKNWIVETRASFLKNKLNQNRFFDESIVQTITGNNFSMTYKERLDDFFIFESNIKIPKLIPLDTGPAIVKVGPESMLAPSFKLYTDIRQIAFAGGNRFNKHLPMAYMDGLLLSIKTTDPLFAIKYSGKLVVVGVFIDPRELSGFVNKEGSPIYSDSYTPFPLHLDMKNFIDKEILQNKFSITEQSIPDEVNDGKDNSIEKMQRKK